MTYAPPPDHAVHMTTISGLLSDTPRALPRDAQLALFDRDPGSLSLYCAGDRSLLRTRCVAIVGTRKPSSAGNARARRLARELARAGVVVVSGLARGIDTAALKAAMEAGGRVVGVIGTPLDKAYPTENTRLQERIYHEHLLISQFAPGQPVYDGNFPMRNRLMAALTDATAIVEAGETSGTLHQALECLRLDRWLFIARTLVDDPALKWPAKFLGQPRVLPLASTADLMSALPATS